MAPWSRTAKHVPTQGVLPATDSASWCWWPWCSGLFWQAAGCALHSPCSSTLGQHACLYPTPTYMFLVSYLRNTLLSVHLVWWSRRRVTTGSWRQTQDVNEVHKSLLASAISVTPAPNTEPCMKHAGIYGDKWGCTHGCTCFHPCIPFSVPRKGATVP